MALFLFRFWPVLLPLLCYVIWLQIAKRRAIKKGETPPHFRDGPIYWLVLSTLLMGIGCFVVMYLTIDGHKGVYVPPHMENGVLVPAEVK